MGKQKMSEYKELEPICRRFDELPDLIGKIPDVVYKHITDLIESVAEDVDDDSPSFMESYETFDAAFGGDVFLLKEIDDLRGIEISEVNEDGGWKTLLDGVCYWFEVVEFIGEKDENGVGEYLLIVHCTNNAGGPSYFIPRSIYYEAPTLQELVKLYEEEEC